MLHQSNAERHRLAWLLGIGLAVSAACAERQSLFSRLQPDSDKSESANTITRAREDMVMIPLDGGLL